MMRKETSGPSSASGARPVALDLHCAYRHFAETSQAVREVQSLGGRVPKINIYAT